MWSQRQTPRSSIAASETFGCQPGPTYGNRVRQNCLASQQPSTKPRSGRPRAQRRPPGTGWAGGRGRWPVRCACSAPRHADVQSVLLARCASKTRASLELRAYSITPGATRLSRLVGCALSLSVFSLWQSPHSACRVCGTTWSSSQVPAVSPQPHSAHLPSCAAGSSSPSPSAASGRSRECIWGSVPSVWECVWKVCPGKCARQTVPGGVCLGSVEALAGGGECAPGVVCLESVLGRVYPGECLESVPGRVYPAECLGECAWGVSRLCPPGSVPGECAGGVCLGSVDLGP